MATEVNKVPEGFVLKQSTQGSVPEGFVLKEEKGSYLSGDQGLVPDTFEDIGKGIYSGIVSVPQGIAELGALGLDAAFDTNTSRAVTEAFEAIKPELDTAGQVTEDLVAFGAGFIPIAGWLGRAGQAAKLAKAGKPMSTAGRSKFGESAIKFGSSATGQKALSTWAGLTGSTAAASMGYSTLVASDGRTTMSDHFKIFPDVLETEEDTGLTGREEAGRRLRNKLRVGAEDGIISGAFDTALKGLGMGARAVGQTEMAKQTADALRKAPGTISRGFMKGVDAVDRSTLDVGAAPKIQSGMQKANQKFKEYFTASGGADPKLYERVQDARARADMYEKMGIDSFKEWESATQEFLKAGGMMKGPWNKTPADAEMLEASLGQYLLGNTKALDKYGNKRLTDAADRMINVRSELDERIIEQLETAIGYFRDPDTGQRMMDQASGRFKLQTPTTPAQKKAAAALKEMLNAQKSQNHYLRRAFEVHTNPTRFYEDLDLSGPQFDQAVKEVASHLVTGKGKAPTSNDLLQARRIVYDSLGLQSLGGLSPQAALEAKRKIIKEQAKGKGFGLLAKERPVLKSIDDIFIERKEILDYSPNLRSLMKEITSPEELYKRTINDMAQASAAADLYQILGSKTQGLGVELVDAMDIIGKGGRPSIVRIPDPRTMDAAQMQQMQQPYNEIAVDFNVGVDRVIEKPDGTFGPNPNYVTPEMIMEQRMQQLRELGYRQLGDNPDIEHVFGGSYGDLTGMFVSPEAYGALTAPLRLGTGPLAEIAGMFSTMRSLSQKMTIVPNPGAQVRNIVGNGGMLAANGNFGRDTDLSTMFKLFTTNLGTLDEMGLDRLARKLTLTGVADTSLVTRALKEFKKAGEDVTVSGKLANTIDLYTDKIPFMKLFEKVYTDSDTFFKGLGLVGEEQKYGNAFKNVKVNFELPEVLDAMMQNGLMKRTAGDALTKGLSNLEVMAGDIVKDTMPIYPRVGKAVKAIDMVPVFGNFTSFASENIRNSVNTVSRGLKEMSFEATPALRKRIGDTAADALEKEIRGIGSQRVLSYAAVAQVIPSQMTKASMMATGTTDEELAALREQLPEYMDGHDLVILGNDKQGRIQYIDLSYVSPYAFVLDPARAALQVYNEKGKLGKSEAEQIASGAYRGLQMFVEPFGAESMVFERFRDVLPSEGIEGLGLGRGGNTATGAEVYSSVDSLGDKIGKGTAHIMNGLIPEYARLAGEFKNLNPTSYPDMVEPGRVYRAAAGIPGKRGEEYNMYKEGTRLITGFTPMQVDLKNDFAFKGLEYSPRRTDAKQQASQIIKRADATTEQMERAWGTYLDNLYREQSKLYADIQSARELGLSETNIRKNLINKANLGAKEVNMIMQGKFFPTAASRELAKEINEARRAEGRVFRENRITFDTFNRMSRERVGEALGGTDVNPPSPASGPAPVPSSPGSLPPGFRLRPSAPAPATVPPGFRLKESSLPMPPQPNVQTASSQVDPALLGDDPATKELAERLNRA